MTITIDLDRALELLDEAVAERGEDYVYPEDIACSYWRETCDQIGTLCEPGCLVGLAWNRAGISADQLAELNGGSVLTEAGFETPSYEVPTGVNRDRAAHFFATMELSDLGESGLVGLGFDMDEGAARVLQAAQHWQDIRKTWGEARDFAREVAELIRSRS